MNLAARIRPVAKPISIGFAGAGNVLFAYLQMLDRIIPRVEAVLAGIVARRPARRRALAARRPGVALHTWLEVA